MRLLVLSPVFPDAPSDGDRVRLFHWLRALGHQHQVTLACLTDPTRAADQGPSALGKALSGLHRSPWPQPQRRLAAVGGWVAGRPVSVAAAASGAFAALTDRLLAQGGYDAVLAYRLKMAPYALRFRGPRFLDYCDSMTRYSERAAVQSALAGRPWAAAFQRRQARRLAAFEAWCAGQFDAGFFNAGQDRDAVQAMAPAARARLHVAANGVDAAHFRPPKDAPRGAGARGQTLVFVGHLAYPPNRDAVLWFVREVLPRVRRQAPAAVLKVLGGDAPAALRALEGTPGLSLEGFVADTRPALWNAAVSVCPVFSGAGRQNKLLEAFAAGTPCVATPLAAAGAEAVADRHLLVAATAPAFADAVLKLLRQPALGRRLALQARGLVGRLYDWEANAARLDAGMARAIRRPLW